MKHQRICQPVFMRAGRISRLLVNTSADYGREEVVSITEQK